MKLNISNPIEAIYLNIFALVQNIELQLMATWVHLSLHLLLLINFSYFKLFNKESAVLRTVSFQRNDSKSQDRQKQQLEVFYKKRCS